MSVFLISHERCPLFAQADGPRAWLFALLISSNPTECRVFLHWYAAIPTGNESDFGMGIGAWSFVHIAGNVWHNRAQVISNFKFSVCGYVLQRSKPNVCIQEAMDE